jgi:hypothetical protein
MARSREQNTNTESVDHYLNALFHLSGGEKANRQPRRTSRTAGGGACICDKHDREAGGRQAGRILQYLGHQAIDSGGR